MNSISKKRREKQIMMGVTHEVSDELPAPPVAAGTRRVTVTSTPLLTVVVANQDWDTDGSGRPMGSMADEIGSFVELWVGLDNDERGVLGVTELDPP